MLGRSTRPLSAERRAEGAHAAEPRRPCTPSARGSAPATRTWPSGAGAAGLRYYRKLTTPRGSSAPFRDWWAGGGGGPPTPAPQRRRGGGAGAEREKQRGARVRP